MANDLVTADQAFGASQDAPDPGSVIAPGYRSTPAAKPAPAQVAKPAMDRMQAARQREPLALQAWNAGKSVPLALQEWNAAHGIGNDTGETAGPGYGSARARGASGTGGRGSAGSAPSGDVPRIIRMLSRRYGIDPRLLSAQMQQESSYNPQAWNHTGGGQGAVGLMQVRAPALADYNAAHGKNYSMDDLHRRPALGANVGAWYMSQQLERYGDWDKALTAYYAGPGAVQKGMHTSPYARQVMHRMNRTGARDEPPPKPGDLVTAEQAGFPTYPGDAPAAKPAPAKQPAKATPAQVVRDSMAGGALGMAAGGNFPAKVVGGARAVRDVIQSLASLEKKLPKDVQDRKTSPLDAIIRYTKGVNTDGSLNKGPASMGRFGREVTGIADVAGGLVGGALKTVVARAKDVPDAKRATDAYIRDQEKRKPPGWMQNIDRQSSIFSLLDPPASNTPEFRAYEQKDASRRQNMSALDTPASSLLHLFGVNTGDAGNTTVGRVQGRVGGIVQKGLDWAGKHAAGSGDAYTTQTLVSDIAAVAPLGAGKVFRGVRGMIPEGMLKAGKINEETATKILDRLIADGKVDPKVETPQSIQAKVEDHLKKSGMELDADEQAYQFLMNGGKIADIQAAVKKNPLVGQKIEEFRAQRESYAPGPKPDAATAAATEAAQADRAALPRNEIEASPALQGAIAKMEARPHYAPTPQAAQRFALTPQEQAAWARYQSRMDMPAPRPPATGPRAVEDASRVAHENLLSPEGRAAREAALASPESVNRLVQAVKDVAEPAPKAPGLKAMYPRQAGRVDTKALITAAAVLGGGALGYTLADHERLEGALAGGLAGLVAMRLPGYVARASENTVRKIKVATTTVALTGGLAYLDRDHPVEGALLGILWGALHIKPNVRIPRVGGMTIDEMVNTHDGAIAAQHRNDSNVSWAIRTLIPKAEDRVALARRLDTGDLAGLDENQMRAVNAYRTFTRSYAQAAKDAGMLKNFITDYVTHVVEKKALPATEVQRVLDELFGDGRGAGGGGTSSKFTKTRKYETFDELERALEGTGLQVKTMDLADLVDIYSRSMNRAINNRLLINSLMAASETGPEGKRYILSTEDAPPNYVPVNNPSLQGKLVHPDIAPSLKFVLEKYEPNAVMRGLLGVGMAQKRLSTGMSFFHAQNLINAYAAASGTRTLFLKRDADAALKAYREGGAGDAIDKILRGGLNIGAPEDFSEHAGAKLGGAIDAMIQKPFGTKLAFFEKGFGALEAVQRKAFDHVTWNYLHTGLKLAVALREYERALIRNPGMAPEEVARQVASFTNDTFGGLDWYRVATETQNQMMRNLGLAALSPKGRAMMQVFMFAPDWTFSTFRAMYKALPGSSNMPLTTRLHQKYVLRTAVMYMTLLNGINMATSGHPIWQNKDPLKIEWRDGTTQQMMKHGMEGPEWLLDPRGTALHKLGPWPSELVEQALGAEYLQPERLMPMQESRLAHLAKNMAPLSLQNGSTPGRSLGESARRADNGSSVIVASDGGRWKLLAASSGNVDVQFPDGSGGSGGGGSNTIAPQGDQTMVMPSGVTNDVTFTLEPGTTPGQMVRIYGVAGHNITVAMPGTSGDPSIRLADGTTVYGYTLPGNIGSAQYIELTWDGTDWRAITEGLKVVAPAVADDQAVAHQQLTSLSTTISNEITLINNELSTINDGLSSLASGQGNLQDEINAINGSISTIQSQIAGGGTGGGGGLLGPGASVSVSTGYYGIWYQNTKSTPIMIPVAAQSSSQQGSGSIFFMYLNISPTKPVSGSIGNQIFIAAYANRDFEQGSGNYQDFDMGMVPAGWWWEVIVDVSFDTSVQVSFSIIG